LTSPRAGGQAAGRLLLSLHTAVCRTTRSAGAQPTSRQAGVSVDREFFVSFTGADRPWAAWLLAELDAAGYSSVSQLRDFVAGGNFIMEGVRDDRCVWT